MKKILTGLLAVVLLFGGVLALSSCGAKPELDFDAVKTALEAKEYQVMIVSDADNLEANEEKTISASKMEGEGDSAKMLMFHAVTYKDTKSAKYAAEKAQMQFDMMIDRLKLEIKSLKNMIDTYGNDMDSDDVDELKEDLKDAEEDLAEYEAYCFGRSGKTVWMATNKDVVKATKGK